jgi:NTP-dependent ternary system trypsin peptidase co-occuring protein
VEDKTQVAKTTVAMVPVKIDEHTIIYIEAVAKESDVLSEEYIDFEIPSFQDVTDAIKSFAKSIAGIWHEIQPSKATVEFGVEVGFEPGKLTAFFVKGSGKGNLKITLEWAKQPESPQTP